MLDQQDAHALAAQLPQHLGERLLLLQAQAGRGLVEQQQGRDRRTARARSPSAAAGRARGCRPARACARPCRCAAAGARPRAAGGAPRRGRGAASPPARRGGRAGARRARRSRAPSCRRSSCTCWKVRDTPSRAIARDGRPSMRPPRKSTSPRVSGSTPVTRLKVVDLPAPFGPIRPTISPARTWKLTSLTATRPPNSLRARAARRARSRRAAAAARSAAARRLGPVDACAARAAARASTNAHRPSRAYCSTSTSSDAEHDHLVAAAGADQRWAARPATGPSAIWTTPAPTSAPQTWPTPPSTAMNRYSMPILQAERRRVDGALEVREEPARDAREQRGDHEHRDLVRGRCRRPSPRPSSCRP